MLNHFFKNIFTFFWDTTIRVVKAKYEINQIYVIKVRHTLLVIARL